MRECCCIFSCFNKLSQTVREIFEHRENQLLFIQEVKLCWLRVSFARVSWAQIASLKMPCYLMVGETTENQHKQRKHVNSTQQGPFLGLNPGLLAMLTTEPPCTNEKRSCKLRVRQKLVGITKEQVETCSAESRDLRCTVHNANVLQSLSRSARVVMFAYETDDLLSISILSKWELIWEKEAKCGKMLINYNVSFICCSVSLLEQISPFCTYVALFLSNSLFGPY